ncbi:MAG: cation:proton antiporter [Spirochaetes bacterium]|jgi:Kef-type K+ transport system membrane component KefB/mannitol/fructose-specific phosphotransferase system IIA component (Ntr-type)|nr:cation:proton antiporter [Spirochaetota bacterium]
MSFFPVHDPVLIFSIVMLSVLVAPLLSTRLRLPGIVGLILFGVVLGPHASNVLERDKTIELLGTIGLLYIMFQAGLEINLEEIKRNKHHSIIFGLLTFFIPLFMGTAAAFYILKMSLPASVLLASMFSSHTLLTFPIVSQLGLSKKKAVAATVGGTIITDTLAFVILAVVIALHSGDITIFFWPKLIIYSIMYTTTVVLLLPRITSWFFRNYFTDSGVEDYVFVLTAVFISAFFSHLIGLEPIIGAFLAGLTLNPLIPEKSLLMNRIQFVGSALFIPFFLISVGMLIDPVILFTNTTALNVSLVMIIIAIVSKDLAARAFSSIVGFNRTDRGLIFGMSINQAAATLAAVLVGYNVGIFSEDVLTGTIMMIIVTCFAGSVITQRFARRIVLDAKHPHEYSEKNRVDRVLIPIARVDNVSELMDFAFLIHPTSGHEPLYPLHVTVDSSDVGQGVIDGETILTKAGIRASAAQKPVIPLNKIDTNISSAILKAVEEQRISKVIMGWNETGKLTGSFLNTIAEQLAKNCSKMIFVVKSIKPVNTMNRIILIVPPYIYKQRGFVDTISAVIKLGSAVSAEWMIVSEEETYTEIHHFFVKQKNRIETYKIESWKNISEQMNTFVKPDDFIVQLISRRGSISWRLNFEKMPTQLCKNFPNNNLLALYPSTVEDEQSDNDVLTQPEKVIPADLMPVSNIMFNLEESDPIVATRQLVNRNITENREAVFTTIASVINEYPLELTDNVVLIHSRTPLFDEYQLFMVVSNQGFVFKTLERESRHCLMIILMSPVSKSTQSHLNILSRISQLVMIDQLVDAIIRAKDEKDFEQLSSRLFDYKSLNTSE